jgi:hypothetical protein
LKDSNVKVETVIGKLEYARENQLVKIVEHTRIVMPLWLASMIISGHFKVDADLNFMS